MTNYARIDAGTAIEVFTPPDGFGISDCFHADVAALFTECPDDVTVGSVLLHDGSWGIAPAASATPPAQPAPPAPPAPQVSPVQFKLLFTAQERVAIKDSADPIVRDFDDIVNDPRLTFVDLGLQSTKDALNYLEAQKLIGAGRALEILTGVVK